MKSITIHNIDTELYNAIKASAKKNHLSLNGEIKEKLSRQFLRESPNKKNDFKKFPGVWDDADIEEFLNNTEDLREINESEWE